MPQNPTDFGTKSIDNDAKPIGDVLRPIENVTAPLGGTPEPIVFSMTSTVKIQLSIESETAPIECATQSIGFA
jgi:hypothetical protein